VAADAAQEVFVRLIERPPSDGVERAWLYKVGTNLVLEGSRTRTRRALLLEGSAARAPIADPEPDAHEHLERDERQRAVRSALAALPDKERSALLMREEGFSHREIAGMVGTTTGSVGTLLVRALDKLAAALPLDPEVLR
ncbi:MAG TPA: sigma-70 family RNA polymerase sigma factor, partial [Gemmatimonadaceae bacterium]|nr:sigma-70 family RNA polymerase sigma factor [Gemmatimonadaceae bacterium]